MEKISRKYKILIPILTFGNQGGFRVLSELSNYWEQEGHEVTVVAFYENKKPYFPIKSKVTWIDGSGSIVVNNIFQESLKQKSLIRIASLVRFLWRNSYRFDVVLANQNLTAWPVWLASKANNFYYIQAFETEFYYEKTLKGQIQRTLSYLSYFLPLSRIVNADIYKSYRNLKAKDVIPPGLDLRIFSPKRVSLNPKTEIVVGCIGRVEKWKGSEDVTFAVKILHEQGYNVKFKVAFNPVEYENYELIEPKGDVELADFYRSLDVLVAPGHLQLGAVHYPVIEAMACKTTVITTGYYPARNENAYLVPIKHPEKIAEAILDIYRNPDLAKSKSEIAYKDIQVFDWYHISRKFVELFDSKL